MTLNACLRLKITIGGLDFTPNYISFAIGLAHIDEQGLCKAIGTLELVPVEEYLEPVALNPRKRPDFWCKGQAILVDAWNTDTQAWIRHPLGTLKLVREPDPPVRDGNDPVLKLDVGCILHRFDFKEDNEDKSNVETGVGLTRTEIVDNIFAPDIPAIEGTIPGSIPYSINKSEASHVQTAGKVAFSGGCCIWQQPSGIVESDVINVDNPPLFLQVLEGECQKYDPCQNQETPCEEVVCTGTSNELTDTWKCSENTYTTTYRGTGTQPKIVKIVRVRECWNGLGKYRQVDTEEWQRILYPNELPDSEVLAFSSSEYTLWRYESSRPGSKLLSVESEAKRPFAAALSNWWSNLSQTEKNFFQYQLPITAQQQTVTYRYSSEEVTDTIATNTQEPIAAVVDIISYNYYVYPSDLVDVGTDEEKWVEIGPGEYQKVTIDQEPIYRFNSSLVPEVELERAADGLANDNVDYFLQPYSTVTVETSSAGGVQPPAPERRPERFQETEKQMEGSYKLQNYKGEKDRKRNYQIDYCTSQEELEVCAKIMSKLLVGRKLGFDVELPWMNAFFNLNTPIPRIDIQERDGLVQSGIASGLAFSHTPEESIVSFQHVWLGTTYGSILQQLYEQGLLPENVEPPETNPLADEIQPPIPGRIVIEF